MARFTEIASNIGYLGAAHYLHDIAPDLILGGHCWATAEPAALEGHRSGDGVTRHQMKLCAAPNARPGLHLVALDTTRDGVRHGELFDLITWVGDPPTD